MLFYPGKRVTERDKKDARKLIKYYKQMGYQNSCVSSTDLGAGSDFIKGIHESKSLFLSANIKKNKKNLFGKGRIYNVKGIKVTVFAITDRAPLGKNISKNLTIEDPFVTMKGLWPSLKNKQGIIILLTSLNKRNLQNLIRQYPAIDLVISSGLGMPTYVPLHFGKTLVVSSHPKGKSVGLMALKVKDGKISNYDNRLIMLRQSVIDAVY